MDRLARHQDFCPLDVMDRSSVVASDLGGGRSRSDSTRHTPGSGASPSSQHDRRRFAAWISAGYV